MIPTGNSTRQKNWKIITAFDTEHNYPRNCFPLCFLQFMPYAWYFFQKCIMHGTSCQKLVNISLKTPSPLPSSLLPSFPIRVTSNFTFTMVGSLNNSIRSSSNRTQCRYTCFENSASKTEGRTKGSSATQKQKLTR